MKFLRYPGGKSKLLSLLINFLPKKRDIEGRYIEPFVGGGSVFLHIYPEMSLLSDLNIELINLYRGIKSYPYEVWETFRSFPVGKEAYYIIRDINTVNKPLYYKAARTLYLNRTCFKGMWRHNPDGNFNVGYGGEERRWVITLESIIELSERFSAAIILNEDFESVLEKAVDGDFIFLDPPYKPGEKELIEAHYSYNKFTFNDQERLANKLKAISLTRNIKWLMTNSAHPDICSLYSSYTIQKIPKGTSSIIGVHTTGNREVIISNYKQEVLDEAVFGRSS